MTVNIKMNDATATLAILGRLDTTTAPILERELNNAMESATVLVLDMEGLEYISSAGLRVLLSAEKKMSARGKMKLCHVREEVMEVLEMTGFADILTIE